MTKEEMNLYGKMYLPQYGDKPEVLAQKRQARKIALEAIKSSIGSASGSISDLSGSDTPPDGVDPNVWGAMTPEERSLWQ